MDKYVVGFAFSKTGRLALIQKNRPPWQKGNWNGIGGKIETDETPLDAMRREFEEETSIFIEDWKEIAILNGNDFVLHFFTVTDSSVDNVKTMTDEQVRLFLDLPENLVSSNINVILSLITDKSGLKYPVILEECPDQLE